MFFLYFRFSFAKKGILKYLGWFTGILSHPWLNSIYPPFSTMVVFHHRPFNQLDIKNVLLHGDLEKEVYMEQPFHYGIKV